MNAMLPANLTETLNNLGDAAKALGDEVRADKEQREQETRAALEMQREQLDVQRKQNRRMISLLVIVAVLVAGLGLQSLANRRLGLANRSLNQQNSRIVERIESCTTIGGKCYEQNARQTQGAISQLTALTLRGDIAVAQCARQAGVDTDAELEACVTRELAKSAPTPAPTPTR